MRSGGGAEEVTIRLAACLAALPVLAGCAAAGPVHSAEAVQPGWIAVGYDLNSWGSPLTSWTIRHDGTGTWTKADGFAGKSVAPRNETRAITVPEGGIARLQAILDSLPDVPPQREACRNRVTDMPYGTLTLFGSGQGGGKSYPFDTGCRDAAYRRYVATLQEADALVAEWGKTGPLVPEAKNAQD